MKKRSLYPFGRMVLLVGVSLLSLLSLIPLGLMFFASLVPGEVLTQNPLGFLFHPWTLKNYHYLLEKTPILKWLFNSLFLAFVVTGAHLFLDTLAGYCLAIAPLPQKKFWFWMILFTLMVPAQLLMLPLYLLMVQFGTIGTFWGVILPQLCSPFGVFMMRQHILGIPLSLVEAARLDGAREFQIFIQVIVPLSTPMMATLGIFIFLGQWNSFLWPLVVLNHPDSFTLPVGLAGLQGKELLDFSLVLAGGALGTLPMIFIFLCASRWFLNGLTQGAVKE